MNSDGIARYRVTMSKRLTGSDLVAIMKNRTLDTCLALRLDKLDHDLIHRKMVLRTEVKKVFDERKIFVRNSGDTFRRERNLPKTGQKRLISIDNWSVLHMKKTIDETPNGLPTDFLPDNIKERRRLLFMKDISLIENAGKLDYKNIKNDMSDSSYSDEIRTNVSQSSSICDVNLTENIKSSQNESERTNIMQTSKVVGFNKQKLPVTINGRSQTFIGYTNSEIRPITSNYFDRVGSTFTHHVERENSRPKTVPLRNKFKTQTKMQRHSFDNGFPRDRIQLNNYVKPQERYLQDPFLLNRREKWLLRMALEDPTVYQNHESEMLSNVHIAFPKAERRRILGKMVDENMTKRSYSRAAEDAKKISIKVRKFIVSMNEFNKQNFES